MSDIILKIDDRKVETISLLLKRLYDLVTGCVCWGQSMKKRSEKLINKQNIKIIYSNWAPKEEQLG